MSMDNGIYILKTKEGGNRVIHTKAIDCIIDCFENDELGKEINPIRVMEFFGECPATRNSRKAIGIAHSMLKVKTRELGYVEYGIQIIHVNKTWEQLKKEALSRIPLERKHLLKKNDAFCKLKLKDLDAVEKLCS